MIQMFFSLQMVPLKQIFLLQRCESGGFLMFPCFMFLKFRDVFRLILHQVAIIQATFSLFCLPPPLKERKMGSPKMCEDSRCLSYGCLGPFCTIVNGCW